MMDSSCKRCGSCCREGGPALHSSDLVLVKSGHIGRDQLITIRCGELVSHPEAGRVQPASTELVKIKGKGRDWICAFFDESSSGCKIYELRPLACEKLKCWDTKDIMALMEHDTLSRYDIVSPESPLYAAMQEHDKLCPIPDLAHIAEAKSSISEALKCDLEKLVRNDLQFRTRQVKAHQLQLADELFYFGRPLFQLLQPFGARVLESPMRIALLWE